MTSVTSSESSRHVIHTELAPAAIGPYSQAIRAGSTVYCSGQIGLDPRSGQLVAGGVEAEARRALDNLRAVCAAAGGSFSEVTRLGLYLADLADFAAVNTIMAEYFTAPYPARSTIGVAALPRGARFEVDAVLVLPG